MVSDRSSAPLLSPTQIYDLTEFADKASTGCLIIPNFDWHGSAPAGNSGFPAF